MFCETSTWTLKIAMDTRSIVDDASRGTDCTGAGVQIAVELGVLQPEESSVKSCYCSKAFSGFDDYERSGG